MAWYIDHDGNLVYIPDDEPPPPGYQQYDDEDPPEDADKEAMLNVEEEDVVEFQQKYIHGTLSLMPFYLDHNIGDINRVHGCGRQFSGKYYTTAITYTLEPGEIEVELDVIRINTTPLETDNQVVEEQEQPRPSREVVAQETTRTHLVAPGENLRSIAQTYYNNSNMWTVIWDANRESIIKRDPRNNENPGHYIYPGQRLVIP